MASNVSMAPIIGEVKPKICGFEWTIPNFVSLSEKRYVSPPFSFARASWNFAIHPNGESQSVGYINTGILRKPPVPPITLKVSFAIKTSDGKKDRERNDTQHYTDDEKELYGSIRCISRDELLKSASYLLPNNVLTVLCSLKVLETTEDASDSETSKCAHCKDIVNAKDISSHEKKCVDKPIKCPECSEIVALKNWYGHECQLARGKGEPCTSGLPALNQKKVLLDLKELFISKEDCDVVIKVKGEEFPAHKAILKARSSVFKSTFRTDMKEKVTGIVEIDDCEPSSFSNFLCYLYCADDGVISKENVFSLFTAADKYDVQDLREKCLEFMKENLTVETFCDTITVALRHSETVLVKFATDFFTKNAAKIVVTVKWQSFLAENPTPSNELIVKLLVPDANLSK